MIRFFLTFMFMESLLFSCFQAGESSDRNKSKPVTVDYVYLRTDGNFAFQDFDIGEVGLGDEVRVNVRIMNRSTSDFEIKSGDSSSGDVRLLNGPVSVAEGDNGYAEMMVKIPSSSKKLNGGVGTGVILNGKTNLSLNFNFRYRELVVFSKEINSFSSEIEEGGANDRPLKVRLSVNVSDLALLSKCSIEADRILNALSFRFDEQGGMAYVEASFPASLISRAKIAGKLRIKLGDRTASECLLILKKQTDIELLPDFVTFKYDQEKQEYRGELIAKFRDGTVPVDQIKIEIEHSENLPISLTIGKMAESTARVYLSIKGTEKLNNDDLLLFRVMTPLKTEEQVLPVAIIR